MFTFDVKPVDELETEKAAREQEYQRKYALWPKGEYDFVVTGVSEGFSKSSGAPMITVEFDVYHPEGYARQLKDYLTAKTPEKIHDLCVSLGKPDLYLSGQFEAYHLEGVTGKCRLGIETDTYNGEVKRKNKIAGYVAPAAPILKSVARAQTAHDRAKVNGYQPQARHDLDDSIPF